MSDRLRNKVCIVTGAGHGIGAAVADCFAHEGAHVVLAEIDEAAGEAQALALQQRGVHALCIPTDITQVASVQQMVAQVAARFGRIDVLVNNAGINVFRDPLKMAAEDWTRCLSVDLEGAWICCQAVLPLMIAAGSGSVINMASTHSFSIIKGCFPYPVAKHGLIGLTRALGIEYAAHGIRFNAIAPGYIETRLSVDYWNSFADPAAARQATCGLLPPKRVGRPEEVGMTAVFLASDEATFINASTIVIDGGRSVVYHD
jgi:NAD(P)-dependent dehydrogenase (short-subunit alcohol dehydrogenase family)